MSISQIISYTAEELRAMVVPLDRKAGEKSRPVIFFDGKPVHEITDSGCLPGEVFRAGKHRAGIECEASNLGRIRYKGNVLFQHEKDETTNG